MLSYIFLPSQKTTLLLIPYHFTIPPTSKNSIFIKILLFYLSLLFLFLGFPIVFFFLRLPQPLAQTTNHKHRHKHKQTQTHADKKKSQPNHDLKPTGANPFKKSHHRSHLSHNLTTTTTHFSRRSTTNDPLQPPIHDQ